MVPIVQRFEDVHGDRYDYSKVRYLTPTKSVTIICREHGEFTLSPSKHLVGFNCPKCGIKKTTFERENRKNEDRGKKRMKSSLKYEFLTSTPSRKGKRGGRRKGVYTPSDFTREKVRQSLLGIKRSEETKKNLSEANKKRWSNPESRKRQSEILSSPKIRTKLSDAQKKRFSNFEVRKQQSERLKKVYANNPELRKKCVSAKPAPKSFWLQKFKKVHGDRYDYSKFELPTNGKQITIICPEHGEFQQNLINHGRGANCRKCNWKNRKQ